MSTAQTPWRQGGMSNELHVRKDVQGMTFYEAGDD